MYVDLKEFKKVLEEENKKGEKADTKKIDEAKNKLLNSDVDLEETSQLLFNMENHTIEYSLQMIDEYLEKDKKAKEVSEEDKKNEHKKLFIMISILFVVLIIVFLVTYFVLKS